MATREKPPQKWKVRHLLDLGKRQGKKSDYLKAVPVLILERWVRKGRKEGVANFVWTKDFKERLERCGLAHFSPKGSGGIFGSITSTQNSRNLTPHLIDNDGDGRFRVSLPYYEPLLQEYRQKYREDYSDDYKKLFLLDEEPDWGSPLPKGQVEHKVTVSMLPEPEVQDDIQGLLASVEQALRNRQQAIERLTKENQKLRTELARTEAASEISFVHTSLNFRGSWYTRKVTSIKNTISAMLKRAEHTIRITTRQMDMFADELIALKLRSPDIEITVLSRGPQAVGDRKKLAGRAFERMKEAGIKMPVEKETLHSRLVVIDAKEVLASSADLDYTHMEQEFNAGIWTNNPDTVTEAIRYFDNLLRFSQGN